MSWATCYSGSNNIHFNFPPIMADGRNFASWQPDAVINQRIQKQEQIKSNWQYRQYLQKNGNQIMNYNSLRDMALTSLLARVFSPLVVLHTNKYPFMITHAH